MGIIKVIIAIFRMVVAVLRAIIVVFIATVIMVFRYEQVREIIDEICDSFFYDPSVTPNNLFVMMVGLSGSGKTTLAEGNELLHLFPKLRTSQIHDALNESFGILRRNDLVDTIAFYTRQLLTRHIRRRVISNSFKEGVPLLSDSCNLKRKDRAWYFRLARRYDYKVVMIYVVCAEEILLTRLKKADQKRLLVGDDPVWEELYYRQLRHLDHPYLKESPRIVKRIEFLTSYSKSPGDLEIILDF